MINMSWFKKNKILLAALLAGLILGSGIGYAKLNAEQKIFQDKLREANKKIAYIQKKMAEEKNETLASVEQRCQEDLDKLRNEKKALGGQLVTFKEEKQKLELKLKETDELFAKTKKELQELARNNKDLDRELNKTKGEKQTLQTDLKKTSKDLGQCMTNNANLGLIAEELMTKYRNKGLGSVLMEKEPITQVKKVELERLTQQYREDIEQLKLKKKDERGKNDAE